MYDREDALVGSGDSDPSTFTAPADAFHMVFGPTKSVISISLDD